MSLTRSGNLSSGKAWEMVPSQKSSVTEGSHSIVHVVDDPDLSSEELHELLGVAQTLACELSESHGEPGRFRIAYNGPAQRVRPTHHIHIILPKGEDALPRLVANMKDVASTIQQTLAGAFPKKG